MDSEKLKAENLGVMKRKPKEKQNHLLGRTLLKTFASASHWTKLLKSRILQPREALNHERARSMRTSSCRYLQASEKKHAVQGAKRQTPKCPEPVCDDAKHRKCQARTAHGLAYVDERQALRLQNDPSWVLRSLCRTMERKRDFVEELGPQSVMQQAL